MAKIYGLTHLAITVSNIERTMNYMEVMNHEKGSVQLTTPGCHDIVVLEEKKDEPTGHTGGIAHFGFRLKDPADIEEMMLRVINAGGVIIDKGEFVPGSAHVFLKTSMVTKWKYGMNFCNEDQPIIRQNS